MWPGDLRIIVDSLINLPTSKGFAANTRPFIYMEVIDLGGGEPISASEYYNIGRVTEFKYGLKLTNLFRKRDQLKWMWNWGSDWGQLFFPYTTTSKESKFNFILLNRFHARW